MKLGKSLMGVFFAFALFLVDGTVGFCCLRLCRMDVKFVFQLQIFMAGDSMMVCA